METAIKPIVTPPDALDTIKHLEWSDHYQAVRSLTKVVTPLLKKHGIDSDFVLGKLSIEQKEYIRESIKHGFYLRKAVPHFETGNRIFERMIIESALISVMERNKADNILVEIVGGIKRSEDNHLDQLGSQTQLDRAKEWISEKLGKNKEGGL